MSGIFDQLTKQYSLSKTLRFELKPVDSSGKWLDKWTEDPLLNKILKEDKDRLKWEK